MVMQSPVLKFQIGSRYKKCMVNN